MNDSKRARFGYAVFTDTMDEQIELAVLAEQLGFDAMSFGEHIVLPMDVENVYMPTDAEATKSAGVPRSVYDVDTRFFDLPGLMAAVARETKRISLVTTVYLATLRHPLMTAHTISSLAELSQGRFQLGVGAGWNKAEFDALGANFADRGSILDETIEVLRMAMKGGPFEHHGRHYSFGPVQVTKDPFHVPILIGGHSAPALRRAARVGDGWLSSLYSNFDDLMTYARRIDALRQEAGTADRPFEHWYKLTTIDAEEIARYRAAGADRFFLIGTEIWGPRGSSFHERCARMRAVAASLRLVRD